MHPCSVTNPTTFSSNATRALEIKKLGNPKVNSRSLSLYFSHIGAMFMKKLLLNFRRYNVVLAQLIVPSTLIALFLSISR